MKVRFTCLASMVGLVVSACAPEGASAPGPATPHFEAYGAGTCKAAANPSRPLVVEWPSADRASLEASARHGIVVVRASRCEIQVLRCRAPGAYSYTAISPKTERLKINNEDELFANLPVGGARLQGKLRSSGHLDVDMTIVGEFASDHPDVQREDLSGGDCGLATHVIVGMTVGAFTFSTSGTDGSGASAEVLGVGAGGDHSSSREVLARDGDEPSCRGVAAGDQEPPASCSGALRIEVAVIGHAQPGAVLPDPPPAPPRLAVPAPDVPCPAGTTWDGHDCAVATSNDPTAPAPSRFAATQSTVIDTATTLTWQRRHPLTKVKWAEAQRYCNSLPLAGGGWRVPTARELASVAREASLERQDQAEGEAPFFWSSTNSDVDDMRAAMVRISDGASRLYFKDYEQYVRCVRGTAR